MIKIVPKNEFTADVPVANSGELCSHGERLATAQALTNRTHNLNGRTADIEAITVAGSGKLLPFASALNSLSDVVLPDKLGLSNVIKTMGEGLAGWAKYAIERIPGVGSGNFTFTGPPTVAGLAPSTWGPAAGGDVPSIQTLSVTSDSLYLSLPGLPKQGYLKSVSITVKGKTGHAALPVTKSRLSVGRILVDVPTGAWSYSEIAAADDASVDVTAYQGFHQIALSGLSVALVQTPYLHPHLKVTGEQSTNALDGFNVYGWAATVSGTP